MKTRKSQIRRMRALWAICRPSWGEVAGVTCLAGIWLGLVIFL
jgi:hypothetical protein